MLFMPGVFDTHDLKTSANGTNTTITIDNDQISANAALKASSIAIAALAFSLAAILFTSLQCLIGNDMTSSALRKTNKAATGLVVRKRTVRFRWWRLRVRSPRVILRPEDIIAAARPSDDPSVLTFLKVVARLHGSTWSDVQPEVANPNHVW